MRISAKTKRELAEELEDLHQRLEEAEETLVAIRTGQVDALVMSGPGGDNVYTLSGADRPYRVIIEAMSEGALTLSPDGVILYSNRRFAELVRTPLQTVVGAPLCRFGAPSEQSRMNALIAGSRKEFTRGKVRLVAGTGEAVPVQLSACAVDLDGTQAICVVVTDLRDMVAAEEALQRAHDNLERRVEERTAELMHSNELRLRFLAMISHELRTPLTSIKGFATTLLAEDIAWAPEQQHDFIQTIDKESDKLTDMIDQILDLARIEVGTLRIRPAYTHLSDVIATALPEMHALASQHVLNVTVPDDLPLLRVDRERIAQVLVNLVGNAAKFSPPHTPVTISAGRAAAKEILVSISDQGPGISADDQPFVFEAFRRGTDGTSRQTKGAGLGLAICKGILNAHGGRIWLDEHKGPGATIHFTLPVAPTAEDVRSLRAKEV